MADNMKTLQLFYAAAMADAAFHYGENHIFDKVTENKKQRQEMAAGQQLKQLGMDNLADTYHCFVELFGCTAWNIEETDSELKAKNPSCLLCNIARKQGAPQPCRPFCINPFTAYAREFGYELDVQETLWDGGQCLFVNKKTANVKEGSVQRRSG